MKNPHAQALQKLAHGVPKNFKPEEIEKRRKRMAEARAKIGKRAKSSRNKQPSGL